MLVVEKKGFRVVCKEAVSFFSHVKGLMFSRRLPRKQGLLFRFRRERQVDIHMLFVFFPIDVVWMDSGGVIVHLEREVRPFTPFVRGVWASSLLELSAGQTSSLNIGDTLILKKTKDNR